MKKSSLFDSIKAAIKQNWRLSALALIPTAVALLFMRDVLTPSSAPLVRALYATLLAGGILGCLIGLLAGMSGILQGFFYAFLLSFARLLEAPWNRVVPMGLLIAAVVLELLQKGRKNAPAPDPSPVPEESVPASPPLPAPRLRKIRRALFIAIGLIDIPWFFLFTPYKLFSWGALAILVGTLAVAWSHADQISLNEGAQDAGSRRVSMVGPLLLSTVLPGLRVLLDFDYCIPQRFFLWVGLGTVGILCCFLVFLPSIRKKGGSLFLAVLFSFFAATAFVGQVNYLLDRSSPTVYAAPVAQKHAYTGDSTSADTYKLVVQLPDGRTSDLHVPEELYDMISVGDRLTVTIHGGALGLEYISLEKPSAASYTAPTEERNPLCAQY